MSELLKGFSHELGQPITNIRYGIQLFQMKMKRGIDTREELETLFDNVLAQISRIKDMLTRFSPITSERNAPKEFCVADEIEAVFQEFSSRFSEFADIKALANIGIDGYVNKGPDADLEELVEMIKAKLEPFSEEDMDAILAEAKLEKGEQ